MGFVYPKDAVQNFRREWERPQPRTFWDVPELPSDNILAVILEVLYHASFTVDEGRHTSIGVVLSKPNPSISRLIFGIPRPFSTTELRRLAPAVDAKRAALGISVLDGKLVIWGIEFNAVWSDPRFTTTAPGQIAMHRHHQILLQLSYGDFRAAAVTEYLLTEFFSDAVDVLLADVDVIQFGNAYPPSFFYSAPLFRLLAKCASAGHGGTVFVVPASSDAGFWENIFQIKYRCYGRDIWASLKMQVAGALKQSEDDELRRALRDVESWPEQLASLTQVDGGVLMTDRYRVLGFGAESLAQSDITHIRMLDGQMRPIESYGTRHRSAFRLCHQHPEVLAFVCSQDGGIKAVKNVDGIVQLYA